MPTVGSYIIYGANGICVISDIRKEKLCGTKHEYYVLNPVDNKSSTIYVPVENKTLVSKMKRILSKEEIIALIKDIGNDDIPWIEDNKLRNEVYSEIIDGGNRQDLLKLIKCIYMKRKDLAQNNKKLWATDENALKRAEKVINEEFSLVLSIKPEDVPKFIENTITTT